MNMSAKNSAFGDHHASQTVAFLGSSSTAGRGRKAPPELRFEMVLN